MTNIRTARTVGVAAVAALAVLTGCSPITSPPTPETTQTAPADPAPPVPSAPSATPEAEGAAALLAAAATAREAVGEGVVTSVEREDDGWEVDVVTDDGVKHTVHTTSDGATVVRGPRADRDGASDRDERRRRVAAATLNVTQAAAAILAARAGTITELELDTERGRLVWEADVHTADGVYEVSVDAATGEVVRDRRD